MLGLSVIRMLIQLIKLSWVISLECYGLSCALGLESFGFGQSHSWDWSTVRSKFQGCARLVPEPRSGRQGNGCLPQFIIVHHLFPHRPPQSTCQSLNLSNPFPHPSSLPKLFTKTHLSKTNPRHTKQQSTLTFQKPNQTPSTKNTHSPPSKPNSLIENPYAQPLISKKPKP